VAPKRQAKIWAGIWAGNVSLKELNELLDKEKAHSLGMVLPREWKEPLKKEKVGFFGNVGLPGSGGSLSVGEKVGSLGRVVSPGELTEPPGGDKVVSPREALWPGMMMSMGIGCNIVGRREWGSPGNIGVAFPVRGGGWSPGSGLFPWVGCSSYGEVGVPDRRREARLKKKNGVRVSSLRVGLWGRQVQWTSGFS
jgi:hypothetical protein